MTTELPRRLSIAEAEHALCQLAVRNVLLSDQRDQLLAALKGLRALILAEFASAYACVDGERADAAIANAEGK